MTTLAAYEHPVARQHARRNTRAFFVDYTCFGLGLVLVNTSTTLPAFAATLTSSKVLIGAVSAIWVGGWLLPQVFAANYLTRQPRKYPVMMRWQIIGRPVLLLFVLWLLAGGVQFSTLTMLLLLVTLAVFMGTDALVALAWMDLFAKAMSPRVRGRLIGAGQVITGLLAVGVGAIIAWALGPNGPAYPTNFIVIFGLACLAFALSTSASAFLVEPPEPVIPGRATFRDYLPEFGRLLRADVAFRRLTGVKLLAGLGSLATAFYVVFATELLRLPPATIGLFAGLTTLGSTLSGLVLGTVADRYGSFRVVQIITWAAALVPLVALLSHLGAFGPAAPFVFPVLYVLLGMYEGSQMLGFFNYLLEIAPAGQRPTYMGLSNTLAGTLIVVPMLGGLVLEHTSYPVLFSCAFAGTLAAALLALRLPRPARAEAGQP